MARTTPAPAPQLEMCDACRTQQPTPLQRLETERTEVKICKSAGPCIARARANGVWMMREAT